jgi:hypothetical protein
MNPAINFHAMTRFLLKSMGLPLSWLKSKREIEITQHRREGALRGWAKRRAKLTASEAKIVDLSTKVSNYLMKEVPADGPAQPGDGKK